MCHKRICQRMVSLLLTAWLLPAVLGTAGAALYFWVTPEAWDTTFSYANALLGAEGVRQLEAGGLSLKQYAAIGAVSAVTCAPFVNMFLSVGEEAGWRGAMYPEWKARFGVTGGRIIGGILWGVWHWPIMLLAGYECGTAYWGAPVTGPLLFCVIAAAMGILLDLLYEKTMCLWSMLIKKYLETIKNTDFIDRRQRKQVKKDTILNRWCPQSVEEPKL